MKIDLYLMVISIVDIWWYSNFFKLKLKLSLAKKTNINFEYSLTIYSKQSNYLKYCLIKKDLIKDEKNSKKKEKR